LAKTGNSIFTVLIVLRFVTWTLHTKCTEKIEFPVFDKQIVDSGVKSPRESEYELYFAEK
jgi:hypothetical protein